MEQEADFSSNRDNFVIRCPMSQVIFLLLINLTQVSLVKGWVINAQGVKFNLNKYYKGMQKSTQFSIFHTQSTSQGFRSGFYSTSPTITQAPVSPRVEPGIVQSPTASYFCFQDHSDFQDPGILVYYGSTHYSIWLLVYPHTHLFIMVS